MGNWLFPGQSPVTSDWAETRGLGLLRSGGDGVVRGIERQIG
jgi:hypothetical protein